MLNLLPPLQAGQPLEEGVHKHVLHGCIYWVLIVTQRTIPGNEAFVADVSSRGTCAHPANQAMGQAPPADVTLSQTEC